MSRLFAKQSPSPPSSYRPDVDGLRAVAALSVVGNHIGLLAGGDAGVDIFFVISGFLISGIILSALERGTFSCFEFYLRRVRRIFPALILVLVAVWGFGWLMLLRDEFQGLGKDIAASSVFIQNFVVYQWVFLLNVPQDNFTRVLLGHLWSLGVEEQFYLLWPILLLATWRLGKNGLVISIVAITAISFGLNAAATSWDILAASLFPWNRLWELSMGGMLAYTHLSKVNERNRLRTSLGVKSLPWLQRIGRHALGFAGAALLLASITGLDHPMAFPGWWALAPSAGSLFVISAGPQSWINRHLLSSPPMVFVGLISYPLYLWHVPLLWGGHILEARWELTPAVAGEALTASFLFAFITYKYVELPLRSSEKTRQVASGLCALLAGCGILGYLTLTGRIPPLSDFHSVVKFALVTNDDWILRTHRAALTPFAEGPITIGSERQRVLFMGDDNMRQYYPRISKVLAEHPLNSHGAVFAYHEWCAPGAIDMMREQFTESFRAACKAAIQKALEYAKDPKVDTVVIAACWYCYFVSLHNFDQFGEAATLKPATDEALGTLAHVINDFVKAGKRVYIVLNTPVGVAFDPHLIVRRTVLPPGFAVAVRPRERSEIERVLRPIKSKLFKIARDTGASVIDPLESLCYKTTCPNVSPDGEPMYSDMSNLRPSYVESSADFMDVTFLDDISSPRQ